jgi:hypothetical protein
MRADASKAGAADAKRQAIRFDMNTIEPYEPRNAGFLKQVSVDGWKLKVYGLSTGSDAVTDELVATGLSRILPELPRPASTEDRYGVGFVIIHRGTLRNWFSLDWWEYEDILFHKLFSSPLDDMASVTAEESSAIACVHELEIINFENNAWINTALSKDGDRGFSNYLGRTFKR